MEIDALIMSVDDPQLPRCLEAVKAQTVPFARIIHNNNVCPYHLSFNRGIEASTGDWLMGIDGDMILDGNAVERIIPVMEQNNDEAISGFYFGLRDTFLNCKIGYISVLRGPLYRTLRFDDSISQDAKVVRRLRQDGWGTVKMLNFVIGTHFDEPDEFQVFKRFYVHGIRYPNGEGRQNMIRMLERPGNPLYPVAIEALKFADKKKVYPGARNLLFDKENYEEYKRTRQ